MLFTWAAAIVPFSRAVPQAFVVQPPVRVSPPGAGPHFWWMINASPTDSKHIVVCGLRSRSETAIQLQAALYGSDDGGESWRTLYADSVASASSEAACTLGRESTTYFVDSRSSEAAWFVRDSARMRLDRERTEKMALLRSSDFGLTWRNAPPGPYADAAVLLVGLGDTRDRDTVVVLGDGGHGTVLVSTDGTRTWGSGTKSLPVEPGRPDSSNATWLQDAVRLADGTLAAVYLDAPVNRYLTLIRVSPSGAPLGPATRIATLTRDTTRFLERAKDNNDFLGARWASIAAGPVPGSVRQRVYVAWHDLTEGRVRVLLSASDDAGRTWTSPRVIDDAPAAPDSMRDVSAAHPSLAVNRSGTVGVLWAEYEGRCWRFSASSDGGATFEPSVPLNTCAPRPLSDVSSLGEYVQPRSSREVTFTAAPSDRRYLRLKVIDWRLYWPYQRGTSLTALLDGTFRAAWVPFGDGDDAIYVRQVIVGDTTELARRHRLLSEVAESGSSGPWMPDTAAHLDYTRIHYDGRGGEFSIGVVVVRPHSAGSMWPVVLKVHAVTSALGPVHVIDPDSDRSKDDAEWVFDGPARSLPAGSRAELDRATPTSEKFEYSQPRTLRFRFDDRSSARSIEHRSFDADPLDVDFEVLVPSTTRRGSRD